MNRIITKILKIKITVFIFLLSISFSGFSQKINYSDVRDSLTFAKCGTPSLDTLYKTETQLLAFDKLSLTKKSVWKYYRDLAMCYYVLWGKTKEQKYAELSIEYHKQTINNNAKFGYSYYDIALIHSFLGNCEIMETYIERYREIEKKKNIDETEISSLLKLCENQN